MTIKLVVYSIFAYSNYISNQTIYCLFSFCPPKNSWTTRK